VGRPRSPGSIPVRGTALKPDWILAAAIAASIFLFAAVAHAGDRSSGLLTSLRRRRYWPLLDHLARFAYYVGVPYLVLRQGIGQPRFMGLMGWSSVADASITVALAAAAFIVLALGWRSYARLAREMGNLALRFPGAATLRTHWVDALLEALYLEVHWAFYRSGPILWLGGDFYGGSCLGILLISAEWLLTPQLWRALRNHDSDTVAAVADWSLAVCMTVGFFFSRSLWLLIALHWWVELGLRQVRRALAARAAL
jgi:hypothetical protein